jgi:hypothetical protein
LNTALIAASLALLAAAEPAAPSPKPSPASAFLTAADNNDHDAMAAIVDSGSVSFLKKIDGCYLRRVYANDQPRELIAAWMCAVGPDRSRVVLAAITQTPEGKVVLTVRLDQTNNRPAPGRTGSAFAKPSP